MLSTPADFPFHNNCTAASSFFAEDGVVILCICPGTVQYWSISIGLVVVQLRQYSVHRFSICRSSVRRFPERSWTEVAFPCFTVVKSFTSSYAVLLLFFLRFSSVSLHCTPIQFSWAFFMKKKRRKKGQATQNTNKFYVYLTNNVEIILRIHYGKNAILDEDLNECGKESW